jgi:hypothetical protein
MLTAARRAARVLFDGKTLIQSTFPRTLSASRDAQQGLIKLKTEKATVDVKPAGEKRPCALDYVMITGEQQAVTFYVPPEPPKPQPLVGQLTAQAVKGLGLPLRTLAADDEAAFRPYFDVPVADFQTDPATEPRRSSCGPCCRKRARRRSSSRSCRSSAYRVADPTVAFGCAGF